MLEGVDIVTAPNEDSEVGTEGNGSGPRRMLRKKFSK
jgi:hypothetical protein